jgi:hypothetical protein
MNKIWIVYYEWEERLDEHSTWHTNFHAAFSTEELALTYTKSRLYKEDDHFSISEQVIYDTLPDFVIRTEPEIRNI